MFKITYKEYLKYEKIQKNQSLIIAEETEEYIYDKNNEHDKVFRDVLSIKEEALSLINKAIKPKKEIKEEIELYNSRFITSKYKERESDIIYKVKNKKEECIMTLGERIRKNEMEEKMRIRNESLKEGEEKGLLKGINATIRKMLLLKLDENIIKEVTGVKDKELEKVKKELLKV